MTNQQKKLNFLILGIGLLGILLLYLSLSKVPAATQANCYTVQGRVAAITSPCCQDISFTLEGDDHQYYINRGLEQGLDLQALEDQLLHREIKLKVIRRKWSLLDPHHLQAPIASIERGPSVVYSALLD